MTVRATRVLLLAAVTLAVAPHASAITVVNWFPAPTLAPPNDWVEGLTWGNGSLWFSNGTVIHELNPITGASVSSFAVASGFINDLAWVEGELWGGKAGGPTSTDTKEIVRYNPADGTELGTIDTSLQGVPEGLAYDGTAVYFSVDGPPPLVYSLDPGTLTITLSHNSYVADAEALAYADPYLWHGGKLDGILHKIKLATGEQIATGQAPTADTHGIAWDGQYLWTSSYDDEMIYQLDVSDVNVAPTLTYLGTGDYVDDGVDPDSGNSTTPFGYRVRFTDADNDRPTYVYLSIIRDGAAIAGSPFAMYSMGDTTYDDGAEYFYYKTLPAIGDYSYRFSAGTAQHVAVGPATATKDGPVVSDAPPTLTFTGDPGYVSDGLEPEDGRVNHTQFEYRVMYSGTLPAQYMRVHIIRNGVPLPASPFDMTTTDATPWDGQLYTYTRKLSRSRDFTYYFEAADAYRGATGAPTTPMSGPVVGNEEPLLAWTGDPGYENGGVQPGMGTDSKEFTYAVQYSDQDRDEPAYCRVHITRGGKPMAGSPFAMTRVSGKVRWGINYEHTIRLTRGTDYGYWFEAGDGFAPAVGDPTTLLSGPIVNAPPYLEWSMRSGFVTDGVKPNRGEGRTIVTFRVVYRDADNDDPRYVRVQLRRVDGAPLDRDLWKMEQVGGTEARSGLEFKRQVRVYGGEYEYRFRAFDEHSRARGVPGDWTGGITITKSTAIAQVTALSAAPTRMGAQIMVNLSGAGTVDARISNLAGRPIRALATNRELPAGATTLLWDGADASGLSAPAGLYLVTVVMRDAAGAQSQAVTRVTLQR